VNWHPDGKRLLYANGTTFDLMAVDIDTSKGFQAGTPRPLFRAPAPFLSVNWSFGPDAQRYIFVTTPDGGKPTPFRQGSRAQRSVRRGRQTEGPNNNALPFNISLLGSTNERYQQVYNASEFPTAFWITALAFRPDADFGGSSNAFSTTLPSVQIDLSTTTAAADRLSAFFASNVGTDNTTVFSGALLLSNANTPLVSPGRGTLTL
jgi:hypothetical protein